MADLEWEIVHRPNDGRTARLKVDGGHIYRDSWRWHESIASSMCFVPDIDLSRYQAHLRDAYKKGYEDGQEDTSTLNGTAVIVDGLL